MSIDFCLDIYDSYIDEVVIWGGVENTSSFIVNDGISMVMLVVVGIIVLMLEVNLDFIFDVVWKLLKDYVIDFDFFDFGVFFVVYSNAWGWGKFNVRVVVWKLVE